ncbi:MAG: LysE family translocator [Hoeflea sp.]|uniref:LysE family translocator n=1 Tax=Hoeflea sp. TaxID=1940281 RepID=UPI0032EFDBBF
MLDNFPGLEAVASLAAASVLIELTPGPNMTWLAMISASEGRKRGFSAVGGVALGLGIVGVAAALGVASLINSIPALYELLRWGGVAFLLFLAWDSWREADAEIISVDRGMALYFRRGLITNLLNPKAAIFFVAVIPAFLETSRPVLAQTLWLSTVYVLIATLVHAVIVLAAGTFRPYLESPERQQTTRRVFAVLLALVAIWFAVSTGR